MTDTPDTAFENRQAARANRITGQAQKTRDTLEQVLRTAPARSTHVPAARERANRFGALVART